MLDLKNNKVIETMLKHRSIRKFLDKSIDTETLETLIECGQSAASSSFIQAYSVIRVTNNDTRTQIANAAGGQTWVEEAPEFLVFCADLKRIEQACIKQGAGKLEGNTEPFLAASVDVALMAQNVLLAAEGLQGFQCNDSSRETEFGSSDGSIVSAQRSERPL